MYINIKQLNSCYVYQHKTVTQLLYIWDWNRARGLRWCELCEEEEEEEEEGGGVEEGGEGEEEEEEH